MNKKNILQNLLRRALTPAGTNMTRWAMALAVVMISLLAPTTEAWADGEEPQQSKPTYQLTSDDGIVHFFLKEGYKMTEVTEAPEGATIVVSPDFDMIPAGKYATGEYTSDQVMVTPALDEDTGLPKNTSDGQFTMPAMAVTVSAVLAPQEEYTIYLNKTMPQTIPESMWILLNCLDDNYVYDEETEELFLDLNLDGKRDVQLKQDYNETTEVTTYSVIRQPGADAITENLRFSFSWDNIDPQQYNSVLFLFKLPAIQPEWITVGDGTALVYNGQAQTPAVIVKDGATDVTSEFDVTYSNNKNACEATAENAPTVTVTAKSTSTDYTGTATATFTIARKALDLVADPVTITEGDPLPDFTGSIKGFVEGEGLGDTDVLTFSVDGTPSTKGEYAVTGKLNGETKGTYGQNYTFDNADANETAFTINPIPTCTLGGLIYMITSKSLHTAELKEYEDDGPTGELVIPASIKFEGTDYSVTSIGQCAFQTTSLASVTVPASVTSIGKNAFMDCQNLQSVTVYTASVPTSDGKIFTRHNSNVKVYVLSELVEAYKNDVNWSTNADIEAMVSITTQPTSSLELTAGDESGKLTVEATAADGHTLTYQWFANTSASNEGGTAISGATEASYTVPTTTADTYYYYCVVTATRTDKKFTATSDVATVTVKEKPKKTIEDKWITVGDGTTIVYNGQAQTPAVIVKDGATDVTSDFDVTYSNNMNACEATADNAPTVTVTAKATSTSYTGSATKTFTIGRKALTLVANKVSIIEGEATPTSWTGSITGFVEGEGLGANDFYYFALDDPAATAVGSYAVTGMLSVNGSEAATNGNYGQNYTFANAADNATAFTINSYQPESSTTEVQNPDGTTTTTTTIISKSEGFTRKDVTVTVKDQNGKVLSQTTSSETKYADGTIYKVEETTNSDGTTHKVEETTNRDGTITTKETVTNPVQLGGTVTVTGSNGESTGFGVIKGGKDISISEITNQPIAIENGKEGAVTIEKTTQKSFLANSILNKSESTVTLRFRSSAFKAGMKITVLNQPDGSSTWEKITPDNVNDGECIVTFNSLARRHSATRGAKAARPFFRIDYSGANITCKAGDVELQAAEEAHGINRGDEQDIIIESGKTYDILTDKNLILTLQPSESDFLLTSFTMIVPKDSDPNDINGDGDVNAVDLVKAIAAGKTQAEIDAIVNSIMGK